LASQGTEVAQFGPFWPRHTDQINAQRLFAPLFRQFLRSEPDQVPVIQEHDE
jgi:hypothetical protein